MRFNKHWSIDGKHAYLGASKHHWIDYDLDKLKRIWTNKFASERGTRIHKVAAALIKDQIRMGRAQLTLNMYVNDAIGYRMTPELVLFVNEHAFGTADACSFEKGVLRIHDLKTGVHQGNPKQIYIYFAYFCLEYNINPFDIEMLGCIYQNDQRFAFTGDPIEVARIMAWTVECSKVIAELEEGLL